MRVKLGKKIFLVGAAEKAKYRAEKRAQLREFAQLAKSARQPSPSPIDYAKEFSGFMSALSPEVSPFTKRMSARDRIISVTSLLDEELRWCITLKMSASRGSLPSKTALDSVFEGTNVLGSFGDRISFCCAFGMLPAEIRGDLGVLKDIRNHHAAHSFLPISWDDPPIALLCQKLQRKLGVKDHTYESDNERKFVESAYMILIVLIYLTYLLVEEHRIMSQNVDAAIQAAVTRWNELWARLGYPDMVTPLPSTEKSG